MPNTTTANWPTLTAGQVARASDVEAKFDWSEHHLWPHAAGSFTSNTFDIGNSTTAYWRTAWIYSINATTAAQGVAIGTTTVGNNSSTALEISGTRAVLFPRLSTAQRDVLTGAEGMVLYNTSTSQIQVYQSAAWRNMTGGPAIGLRKVVFSTTATTTSTALDTGAGVSGRLKLLATQQGATTGGATLSSNFIIDSISSGDFFSIRISTAAVAYLTFAKVGMNLSTTTVQVDTQVDLIATEAIDYVDLYFRDQLKVFMDKTNGTTDTATASTVILFERSG